MEVKHITLSNLQDLIRRALERGVPQSVWVVAQVSDAKLNYSGHFYMELVERSADQQQSLAVARAVIWSKTYRMVGPYFESVTGGKITAGQKLLMRCSVSYHPVYGLSLVVEDIEPSYTVGLVEVMRRQTVARLRSEGVYDMNRQWELPPVVQRVALVSSATAAGYQDFMNEVGGGGYDIRVTLFQATMQGAGAAASIVDALDKIAEVEYEFDAVVIIRGGGSVSDLACFDEYELCVNVAQFPLPVITGIGHDRDTSAADMVANVSFKTPTAVAAALVGWCAEFDAMLIELGRGVTQGARGAVQRQVTMVDNCARFLSTKTGSVLSDRRMELMTVELGLRHGVVNFTASCARRLDECALGLSRGARGVVDAGQSGLDMLQQSVFRAANAVVDGQTVEIKMLELGVQSANPRRILSLGYAIVRGATANSAIKGVGDLAVGDSLTIELADGAVTAVATDVRTV